MKNPLILILFFLLPVFSLAAQEIPEQIQAEPVHGEEGLYQLFIPEPPRRSLVPEHPEPAPRQFRGFYLGMSLDDLQTALSRDELFLFRGRRDVSFLPVQEETLVETTGNSFIRRAHFQLNDEAIYIMSFTLDTRLMDHHSVFTAFMRRYGEPVSLNPQEAVWESEYTRVSIERPLTVKYIDKTVFNRLIEESRAEERGAILRRENFLADF